MQFGGNGRPCGTVALLAEGVDRNTATTATTWTTNRSPSSRRAWIEIREVSNQWRESHWVALLAEGVDRNTFASMPSPGLICRPPRGGRG